MIYPVGRYFHPIVIQIGTVGGRGQDISFWFVAVAMSSWPRRHGHVVMDRLVRVTYSSTLPR